MKLVRRSSLGLGLLPPGVALVLVSIMASCGTLRGSSDLPVLEQTPKLRHHLVHTDLIWSQAFSPDGSLLATVDGSGTGRIWKTEDGRLLRRLEGHEGPAFAVAFSPDGSHVLTGGEDATARVWSVATGKPIAVLGGHDAAVWAVVYSSDGREIATGTDAGVIRIFDAESEALLQELAPHADRVLQIVFSEDGRRLATAGLDKSAAVLDRAAGTVLARSEEHDNPVLAVCFCGPDNGVVAVDQDGRLARLGADGVTAEQRLPIGEGLLQAARFEAGGPRLLTGSENGEIALWDAVAGERLWSVVREDEFPLNLALAGDLAQVALFNMYHGDDPDRVTLDHSSLLLGHGPDPVVRARRDLAVRPSLMASLDHVLFSRDGASLVTSDGRTAVLWDLEVGAPALELPVFPDGLVLAGQESRHLITGGLDGSVRWWTLPDGKAAGELLLPGREARRLAASPDGRLVAAALSSGPVYLIDAAAHAVVRSFGHPRGEPWKAVTFSEDSTAVLAAASDGVHAFPIDGGPGLELLKASSTEYQIPGFSPDAGLLVTATGTEGFGQDGRETSVFLWDLEEGRLLHRYEGHRGAVRGVAFRPGGRQFATASWDDTVRIWDIRSGEQVAVLRGHRDAVTAVVYGPDGGTLATASGDGTFRLWDADSGEERVQAVVLPTGRWAALAQDGRADWGQTPFESDDPDGLPQRIYWVDSEAPNRFLPFRPRSDLEHRPGLLAEAAGH